MKVARQTDHLYTKCETTNPVRHKTVILVYLINIVNKHNRMSNKDPYSKKKLYRENLKSENLNF